MQMQQSVMKVRGIFGNTDVHSEALTLLIGKTAEIAALEAGQTFCAQILENYRKMPI